MRLILFTRVINTGLAFFSFFKTFLSLICQFADASLKIFFLWKEYSIMISICSILFYSILLYIYPWNSVPQVLTNFNANTHCDDWQHRPRYWHQHHLQFLQVTTIPQSWEDSVRHVSWDIPSYCQGDSSLHVLSNDVLQQWLLQ